MVPCKTTAQEVSFEWSHHRISSTEAKVETTSHVSAVVQFYPWFNFDFPSLFFMLIHDNEY